MSDAIAVAIISGLVTTVAVGIPSIMSARNSGKSARNTSSVNGQTIAEQVGDLHHLFVSHEKRDELRFTKAEERDGELGKALIDLHDYTHKRWHRDDNRHAVLMLMMAVAFDPHIPEDKKHEALDDLQQRYKEQVMWDGETDRRGHG